MDVEKILVISLSNIGDVVLTCPVIDSLIDRFPTSEIFLVVGQKAKGLFDNNPYLQDVLVFDKQQPKFSMLKWAWALRQYRFDMVVDLRHTAIPLIINPKRRTSLSKPRADFKMHMKDKHFKRLQEVVPDSMMSNNRYAIFLNDRQEKNIEGRIGHYLGKNQKYYVVSTGSANPAKRWNKKGFASICHMLKNEKHLTAVFVGDENDNDATVDIIREAKESCINLCGKIDLLTLSYVLQESEFVLANDSAVAHLASYFNIPALVLFGPSSPQEYGPWGKKGYFLKSSNVDEKGCSLIDEIDPKDVFDMIVDNIL
ncbi:MAG: glycosyltransferase family 9 protein [Candidatus Aceula meridiana]|nr:glycosyltransferase family 9 protein [Candidatus Aceula meridiana]